MLLTTPCQGDAGKAGYKMATRKDASPAKTEKFSTHSCDYQGNPPEKALTGEVEISRREFLHEEVQVFRQPDHGSAQAR